MPTTCSSATDDTTKMSSFTVTSFIGEPICAFYSGGVRVATPGLGVIRGIHSATFLIQGTVASVC